MLVDSLIQRKGYGHTIGNFTFKNQFGEEVSKQTLKGKIFVAEYFFTTCGTICPKMNIQMQRVQEAYQSNQEIQILSLFYSSTNRWQIMRCYSNNDYIADLYSRKTCKQFLWEDESYKLSKATFSHIVWCNTAYLPKYSRKSTKQKSEAEW